VLLLRHHPKQSVPPSRPLVRAWCFLLLPLIACFEVRLCLLIIFLLVGAALQEAVGGRNDEPQDVSAIDTSAAGANILNPMVSPQHSSTLSHDGHCLILLCIPFNCIACVFDQSCGAEATAAACNFGSDSTTPSHMPCARRSAGTWLQPSTHATCTNCIADLLPACLHTSPPVLQGGGLAEPAADVPPGEGEVQDMPGVY
jgi:hypothetical protein